MWEKIRAWDKKLRLRIFVGIFLVGILVFVLAEPASFEPDAVRNSRHEFAGEAMPVGGPYFWTEEALDREIQASMLSEAQIVLIRRRAQRYGPEIREKLRAAELPEDLFYVALVESALRDTVFSSAGAAGMWQFMPETARRFGLRVDSEIDERLDWRKSTDAAIEYFQVLHDRFGEWTLAAAAYNRGENWLERDLNGQFVTDFYDSWLNAETRRYVFRILAMKEIFENIEKRFSAEELGQGYEPPLVKEIRVEGPVVNLAERAVAEGLKLPEIKVLNPWIVGRSLPAGVREIRVARFRN